MSQAAISNVIEEDQSHSNSNYNDMNLGNPSFIDTPGENAIKFHLILNFVYKDFRVRKNFRSKFVER